MKKIINGKKYDTETAKKVATWENGLGYKDFGYCEETLYLKKTGEFFLYGAGGPMTKYAQAAYGGGTTSGEDITPLTEAKAKKWAEDHVDADAYEKIFGDVEE